MTDPRARAPLRGYARTALDRFAYRRPAPDNRPTMVGRSFNLARGWPLPALAMTLLLWAGTAPAAAAAGADGGDWPTWRGPRRDGISPESVDPARWPPGGPPVLWKASIGQGYAAVAVVGGRVYAVGNGGEKDTVRCLDAATGEVIWAHTYDCPGAGGGFPGPAVAPQVDDGLVYTQSRVGHLWCLKADGGAVVWSKPPDFFKVNRGPPFWHGAACHAVIDGDKLLLETGGEAGSFACLNKKTGDVLWQAGDERLGYASPIVTDIAGKRTLVAFTGAGVVGLDVNDGKALWRYPMEVEFQCSIVTPIVSGDRVFVSTWYWDKGSAVLKVSPGGKVDEVWNNPDFKNHANNCVLWQGHLYGFHGYFGEGDRSLKCIDFATGEEKWSAGGMGAGSLVCADGRLVILSETGELVVAEATPEKFKRLGKKQILGGQCWGPLVLADGKVYAHNHDGELVCVDVSGTGGK